MIISRFNWHKTTNIQMAVLPKVRSALCAASQGGGGGGGTDVEDAPAPAR